MRQLTDRIRRSVAQAGGPAAPQQAARPATRTADRRPAPGAQRPPARREASSDERPRAREAERDDREREAPARGTREARSAR
jgi:hypothetical protein